MLSPTLHGWRAGWLASWLVDLHCSSLIYMHLDRFDRDFWDSEAWLPGGLWRAVAGCGNKLWPVYSTILRGEGWQACRLAGWCLAEWLDGWLAG